jgi:GNAT superfamily N-acetyltransferase
VPGAPPVPGLAFRRYRGEGDLPAMVEVHGKCEVVDGWSMSMNLEAYENLFRTLKNTEVEKDVVIAEVDGRVIGYSKQLWEREEDDTLVFPFQINVVPEWRGHGIRRAMLGRCEARAREAAGELPSARERMTSTWMCEEERPMIAILEDEGWRPARYFHEMLRPLDKPIEDRPLPEGLTTRAPAGEDEYRMVFDALYEALEGHWGIAPPQEEDYQRFRGRPTFQPENWMVAWDGDRVAGTVLNWIDKEENESKGRLWGYTEEISVGRPYRRQGLAKALISMSLALLRDRGMTHANLGVDTDNANRALDLYSGLGYRPLRTWMVYRKELGGMD